MIAIRESRSSRCAWSSPLVQSIPYRAGADECITRVIVTSPVFTIWLHQQIYVMTCHVSRLSPFCPHHIASAKNHEGEHPIFRHSHPRTRFQIAGLPTGLLRIKIETELAA